MFRESVSQYCRRCVEEAVWQNPKSLKKGYICRACYDALSLEFRDKPMVGDAWSDEWYKGEGKITHES